MEARQKRAASMRQETTQGAMMNETISEREISAAEWERIIYELWDEGDFEKLYVAAMLCAKECRYRAEDFGGEEWRYWTRADLEVKF